MGVAFIVEDWVVKDEAASEAGWGPLSGQIVSTVKECCRKAFLVKCVRLMTAMYSCNISVKADTIWPERGPQPASEAASSFTTQSSTIKATPIIGSSHKGPAKVANWNPWIKLDSKSDLASSTSLVTIPPGQTELLAKSVLLMSTLEPHLFGPRLHIFSLEPASNSSFDSRSENVAESLSTSIRVLDV